MNYLERLSSGDVKTICELIGPRELKQNFRANSDRQRKYIQPYVGHLYKRNYRGGVKRLCYAVFRN